jgi:hypothetical protein
MAETFVWRLLAPSPATSIGCSSRAIHRSEVHAGMAKSPSSSHPNWGFHLCEPVHIQGLLDR